MTDEEMKAMLGSLNPIGDSLPQPEPIPNIGILIPIGSKPFHQEETSQQDEEVTEDTLRREIAVAVDKMHNCLGDRMESDLTLTDEYWSLRDRVHVLQGQLKTLLNIAGPEFKKGPE